MVRGWNHLATGSFLTRLWRRALIFLTAVGLGVLGAGAALAQDDLSVAIRTDREVYPAGDPVKVTYDVTNQSGQTIHLEGSGCVPLFNLVAYDADGQEIWNAAQCPLCCCTCCQCVQPPNVERDIPPGD